MAVHPKVVEFLELLEKANCVNANSPLLTSWTLADPTGEPDNEVVHFSWEDQEGRYSLTLTEGAIANGAWVGSDFFCDDHEGDEVQISVFETVPMVAPSAKALQAPSAAELAEQHGGVWGEHPAHPVEDWRYQIANGDTRQGYWDWVAAEVESAMQAQPADDAAPGM